jgi:flagellar biosynthetic protein FlhB
MSAQSAQAILPIAADLHLAAIAEITPAEARPYSRAEFDFRRLIAIPLTAPDLQRFAAEDEGRTEDPTDRRKREERGKGNVVRSQDIPSSAVLLGTVLVLFFLGTFLLEQVRAVFLRFFNMNFSDIQSFTENDARRLIFDLFWESGKIVAPVVGVALVMGVIGNVAQFGLLFTAYPLQFRFEKLVPDFKRILPNRRTMFSLGKTMVQFVAITVAAYLVIVDDFIPMLKSSGMGLTQAIGLFAYISFKLLIVASIIMILIAIPDYLYQRYEYMENLKMTVSEAKRERRDEEGDPMIRQRQRDRAYELRRQRNMLREVPNADIVITNPTHYAVALKYDPDQNPAPVVIAKGTDHLAFTIRTIARENGIPVQENPQLARLLYRDVEVGKEIPETLYRVVSTIFSKLDKFSRAR